MESFIVHGINKFVFVTFCLHLYSLFLSVSVLLVYTLLCLCPAVEANRLAYFLVTEMTCSLRVQWDVKRCSLTNSFISS